MFCQNFRTLTWKLDNKSTKNLITKAIFLLQTNNQIRKKMSSQVVKFIQAKHETMLKNPKDISEKILWDNKKSSQIKS